MGTGLSSSTDYTVRDNPAELRYEILAGDELLGVIRYVREPGTVVLVHTEIEPKAEGKGVGPSWSRARSPTSGHAASSSSPRALSCGPTSSSTPSTTTLSSRTHSRPTNSAVHALTR